MKFMYFVLTFLLFIANAFSKSELGPIYLAGERGQFFQRIFEKEEKFKSILVKDIDDAKLVMMFEPSFVEAQVVIRSIKDKNKRIIFLFYNKIPPEFRDLPSRTLSTKAKWLEYRVTYAQTSTPFGKLRYPDKVILAIQTEAWREFSEYYFYYDSKPVSDISQWTGIRW